jgi:hypothetical protein
MGTLVFVCPTTGHDCPRCRKNHMLAAIWAWLIDEVRESPEDSTSTKSAA